MHLMLCEPNTQTAKLTSKKLVYCMRAIIKHIKFPKKNKTLHTSFQEGVSKALTTIILEIAIKLL